ncbi:MAG TPA: excisionase family DNA-binding protein [Terracidiphilus sp.]|nr:excisionase family DNA-binding protein [Terracidiphilus sp.]
MRDTITMQPSEESEIRELHRMLNLGTPALVGPKEERLNLPESVYHLLKGVVANMMRGRVIVLTPQNDRLTTQAAANFLGFSRPHLVKLLESGAIPFERVGQHRRILMKDLLTYQRKRDADRRRALNDLARAEFDEGSYDGTEIPEGESDE